MCCAELPAGVVVQGAKQERRAKPIKKAKKVTLKRVFIGTQSTPAAGLHVKLGLVASFRAVLVTGDS